MLTIGAPLWPMSFGFLSTLSVRQGEWMNRGHRKMAADTNMNATAMRILDTVENRNKKIRQQFLHYCCE